MVNTQNIRIIEIPAMTVASIQCISTSPEKDSLKAIAQFVEQTKLYQLKTDLRHFGYIPPFDKKGNADIDIFERLITIPENMKIQAPFTIKAIPRTLYAAYTVPVSNFDKVSMFKDAVNAMPNYRLVNSGDFDVMEECLNGWLFSSEHMSKFFTDAQIDVLVKVEKIQ